jgi:hypothetical protein
MSANIRHASIRGWHRMAARSPTEHSTNALHAFRECSRAVAECNVDVAAIDVGIPRW